MTSDVAPTEREQEMYEALKDCADDLAAELDERYSFRSKWFVKQRRYDRDMEPVRRARAILARIEAEASTEPANDLAPTTIGA